MLKHLGITVSLVAAIMSWGTFVTKLATAAIPAVTTVVFRVRVPESTPATDTIFVAGDFQGWNPHDPRDALHPEGDARWSISLALPSGAPIEFKFTRGSWERVEKGPQLEELSNRTLSPVAGKTYEFTVARWAEPGTATGRGGASTITGHVESFQYAPFLEGRRIWVYLPPDYSRDSTRRYPVLYMHDGQNLFDQRTSFAGEWQVDETCERLIAAGEVAPLIVVGIENGGTSRMTEYTPWPDGNHGGGGGAAYLAAVRDSLKPEVDRRYRTLPDRAHT